MVVKLLIDRGAAEPEVGAEVDHHAAGRELRHRELRGDTVRQGEEDDVGLRRQHAGVGVAEAKRARLRMAGELREDLRDGLPRALARGDGDEVGVGMA